MGFEKLFRLSGVKDLLAECFTGDGFEPGGGCGPFPQWGCFFRYNNTGLPKNPECGEVIVLAETGKNFE